MLLILCGLPVHYLWVRFVNASTRQFGHMYLAAVAIACTVIVAPNDAALRSALSEIVFANHARQDLYGTQTALSAGIDITSAGLAADQQPLQTLVLAQYLYKYLYIQSTYLNDDRMYCTYTEANLLYFRCIKNSYYSCTLVT